MKKKLSIALLLSIGTMVKAGPEEAKQLYARAQGSKNADKQFFLELVKLYKNGGMSHQDAIEQASDDQQAYQRIRNAEMSAELYATEAEKQAFEEQLRDKLRTQASERLMPGKGNLIMDEEGSRSFAIEADEDTERQQLNQQFLDEQPVAEQLSEEQLRPYNNANYWKLNPNVENVKEEQLPSYDEEQLRPYNNANYWKLNPNVENVEEEQLSSYDDANYWKLNPNDY